MRICKFSAVTALLLLTSCGYTKTTVNETEPTQYYQEVQQLYIEQTSQPADHSTKTALNYDVQYARWLKYLDYSDIMLNKTEDEFKKAIENILDEAKADGINTIYFQVRAFGDAYYKSQLYPKGAFNNGDYDPLKIIISESHSREISLHAWINPLRCQTAEEYKSVSDDYILKKWFNEYQGKYICSVDGRMWLNPAYEEVRTLINDGITEILDNYDVDGIHIDDYFYPTVSEDFDKNAFDESGADDLSQWRTENINKLVSSIYQTVNKYNGVIFGVSPQGNISQNYSVQYADVKKWCSEKGYCDYIVPQIYFGFKNETCPFEQTLSEWYKMTENSEVKLSVGLAVYKEGKEDKWAGNGKNEWIEDSQVIQKQKNCIKNYSDVGYALYY